MVGLKSHVMPQLMKTWMMSLMHSRNSCLINPTNQSLWPVPPKSSPKIQCSQITT